MSGAPTVSSDFDAALRDKASLVTALLERLLAEQPGLAPDLREAMQYTLTAPGKRIRSVVLLWCCELIAGRINRDAEIAAAAVEMVHTYSLVHDDLPAMDDDDMRRGRPTCHKAFDEATAILTGDAMLTLAFGLLAEKISKPATALRLISELARAAGGAGMIAGQIADIRAENTPGDLKTLEHIHVNKTAKMFGCAAVAGGLCAAATDEQIERLRRYGLKVGLGFQIADDILDVSAPSEQIGKTAGKDAKAAKCTYPAVVGLDRARQLEAQLADEAVAALEPFGPRAEMLRRLARALLRRTK